jgi:GntR family transcriptional regulator, transcriptional repressor for pyruvate dehydrogenase complex
MVNERSAFRPVARTPLSMLVSRQLRDAIVSGELEMGTELPSEKELTEHFGVSRSTVREALRILQAQGLLSGGDTVSTNRPRVSDELTATMAAEALENVLRLGCVPLGELVELRLLLEGAAVEEGVVADPNRLDAARSALVEMRQEGVDVEAFHDADVRFHISLAGSGGNRAVPLVMQVLRHAIAGHLRGALETMDDPRPTLERLAREHAAILRAVERGDGRRARRLLQSHVRDFYAAELGPHG